MTAQEDARIISGIMNHGPNYKELARELANDHRTLQQNTMRFCVEFIRAMRDNAAHERTDARNEAACTLAVHLCSVMEQNPRIAALPLI